MRAGVHDDINRFQYKRSDAGSIAFAGGTTNPLIGLDIPVESVKLIGGSSIAFTDNVVLNFTSGNFVTAVGGEWVFGSGGSISIAMTQATSSKLTLPGSFHLS